MKLRIPVILCAALTMLVFTLPAQAATVVGNGTPQSCTFGALRDALKKGGDIRFNCGPNPVKITVQETLFVGVNTTIDGGGKVTLDGQKQRRIMLIKNELSSVTIRNMKFINGRSDNRVDNASKDYLTYTSNGNGGAIHARTGTRLTIENSVFKKNTALTGQSEHGGGAVRIEAGWLTIRNSKFVKNKVGYGLRDMKHYNPHGSGGAVQVQASNVEITDTVFKKNKAKGPGGAYFNDGTLWEKPGGYIRIERTRFIGNQGGGQGGALFSFNYKEVKPGSGAGEGTLTIRNVEFIENRVNVREVSADGSGGKRYDSYGGAARIGNGKKMIIENTLFYKNVAVDKNEGGANNVRSQGGGLWTGGEASEIILTNLTFYKNSAEFGGGLAVGNRGTLRVINNTFAKNKAKNGGSELSSLGGGIYGGNYVTTFELRNTIFVKNKAKNGNGRGSNCSATHPGSNVLEFPQDVQFSCMGTANVKDALVNNPAKNGGFGMTMSLKPDSPAVAIGRNCPATDARGQARPTTGCDAGAFELPSGSSLEASVESNSTDLGFSSPN